MERTMLPFVVLLMLVLAVSCGTGGATEPPFEVSSTVVSHETTMDIWVWAPDADGSWPVVYALHGLAGSGQSWAEAATVMASQGVLVFAADYRSIAGAVQGRWDLVERDSECGYRYVRSIADEYGGNLDQPVTFVGHSMGATVVLESGLDDAAYGSGGTYDACFSGAPRPDVIVAVAGCHYEFEGFEFDFDPSGWTNQEADLVLVVGEDDAVCEAWQSKDAATALRSAGYDISFVEIADANHFTVIFHDFVEGEWTAIPDEPAGQETVQAILDAIAAAEQ